MGKKQKKKILFYAAFPFLIFLVRITHAINRPDETRFSKSRTGSEATSRPGCRSRRRARNARSARRRSLLSTLARTRASVHFLSRSFPRPFLAALPVRLGVFHHAFTRVSRCACHERVLTRSRNPPIKTHPIACNATAPFARMRFFHPASIWHRPFPRRTPRFFLGLAPRLCFLRGFFSFYFRDIRYWIVMELFFLLFVVAFDRLEPRVDRDSSKGGIVGFVTFSILDRTTNLGYFVTFFRFFWRYDWIMTLIIIKLAIKLSEISTVVSSKR